MGLDPIGYKPWQGKRTEHKERFWVISDNILRQKLRSTPFIALMVIGMFLVHVFPLIMNSMVPHQRLYASMMFDYMQSGVFFIFDVILVSLVCSDLISDDMRSNSIVLYLSRALKPEHYLLGKWLGALIAIIMFTMLPPLAVAISITATQSGSDYLGSLSVIGQTAFAGLWTALFLIPVGLMISTITNKRTYAGVGTFMFFFIMVVIAQMLVTFSIDWAMLSPQQVLDYSYMAIFGQTMDADVNQLLLALMIIVLTVPPIYFVYDRIRRKGVGK
jgi:ABC-type transport system involved in multi-copper enzyme maturation permease subunit